MTNSDHTIKDDFCFVTGSEAKYVSVTRNKLVEWVKDCNIRNFKEKCDYLVDKVTSETKINNLSEESQTKIKNFLVQYNNKWLASSRNVNAFRNKNVSWLDSEVQFSGSFNSKEQDMSDDSKTRGRPIALFLSSSDRTKRRKTEQLRSEFSPEELTYAAQMQFRSEGHLEKAEVIKNVVFSTPTRASKYKKAISDIKIQPFSPDQALSIFVEAKLTKFQYNVIRDAAKSQKSNLYPNYESITLAKKRCYPSNITISEDKAEVPLQNLLDHSILRLSESLREVFDSLKPEQCNSIYLISKWGCDGSSGMSEYKQKFLNPNISDANIFLTSMVPLQLINGDPSSKENLVIWQNPRPSSTRFCRPIRIQFKRETTELSVMEMQHIQKQISELQPTKMPLQNSDVFVQHKLYFTMIDGKICNAVTENASTQRCYICGLTSKDFNNVDKILQTNVIDECRYQFGLSSLHAWIRFFECLLHVSYKLVIQQWQARGNENKELVANNKKRIQELFQKEMGLLVDKPKPGFGSTNDGNTARRFFEDADTSSKITGIDKELITRFRTILLAISSGYSIKVKLFKNYCLNTARRFIDLYPWYNMPTSVHKILFHSSEIISYFMLPIGQLGEEAQESRNKDIKRYREFHSRKFSRMENMQDMFCNLLVSSDPLISSMKKSDSKKLKKYPLGVLKFFEEPFVTEKEEESDSDTD